MDMGTSSRHTTATDAEPWDWRDSIWEKLTNKNRTGSFHFGVDKDFPLLNEIVLKKWPKFEIEQIGKATLYRIDTLDHVLSAISTKRLYLPRPSSWEDPWEDPIWRFLEKDGQAQASNMAYDCFALCLTTMPSCEAIWRRMKGKGRLVRIETTVERLLSSIRIPDGDDTSNIDEQVFLQDVYYLDETHEHQFKREISGLLQSEMKDKFDIARVASLFVKRKPFEYEREYRLVFRPKLSQGEPRRKAYELDLKPGTLIESLQIDPWCGDCEYGMVAREFKDLGFDCSRSDLAKSLL